MNHGDPILWTDADGKDHPGVYIATHGGRVIIETVTPSGHLGLRYVDPKDVRTTSTVTVTQEQR